MPYVLQKDGTYITYKRPKEQKVNERGSVVITNSRDNAYVFRSRSEAEKEKNRLTKKAKDFLIVKIPSSTKKERKKYYNKRKKIYNKTSGRCYLCGSPVDINEFEIEHKIPKSNGGTSAESNLFCACHVCNKMKGVLSYEDFIEQAKRIASNNQDFKIQTHGKKWVVKSQEKTYTVFPEDIVVMRLSEIAGDDVEIIKG